MNWFKKAAVPFMITSYNSNGDMTVRFKNNNKLYTYYDVNNRTYHKLENLLKYKNYSAAMKILNHLANNDRLNNNDNDNDNDDNNGREKQLEFDF